MGTPKKTSKKLQSQLRPRTTRSSKARLLSDPMENTALLTEQLRSLGLYAAPTIGDGNCLFRALSDQLYGSPSRHPQLRREVCDWIAGHKARYEPFVEDERGIEVHLRCMRENATYGGHMELSAFAHLTRRNVKVIQPGLVYVIEWAAGEGASPTTSAPLGLSHSSSSSSLSSLSSLAPSAGASPAPGSAPAPSSSLSLAASGSAAALASALAGASASASGSRRPDGVEVIDNDAGAGGAQVEEGTIYIAYDDWEHFSIRNLKGPHTGLPAVRETPPYPYPSSPISSEHADSGPKQSKADAKERKRMEAEAKDAERETQRKGKPPSARDENKQEGKVLPKVRGRGGAHEPEQRHQHIALPLPLALATRALLLVEPLKPVEREPQPAARACAAGEAADATGAQEAWAAEDARDSGGCSFVWDSGERRRGEDCHPRRAFRGHGRVAAERQRALGRTRVPGAQDIASSRCLYARWGGRRGGEGGQAEEGPHDFFDYLFFYSSPLHESLSHYALLCSVFVSFFLYIASHTPHIHTPVSVHPRTFYLCTTRIRIQRYST